MVTYELEITTQMENMGKIMGFLEEHLSNVVDDKTLNQLMIVGEELTLNIFNNAYEDDLGMFRLSLSIWPQQKRLSMEFRDSGKPFNPLSIADPDLKIHIKNRKIGGMGVLMSKKLTDEQQYIRENNQNILTVIKNYEGDPNE